LAKNLHAIDFGHFQVEQDDCRVAFDRMRARGVEFTQEPVDRYGTVDAGFRDPSGNGWKMIEARR